MRDKLLIELIVAFMDEAKSTKSLDNLKMRFTKILSKYDVSERCTALQVYNYFPNEAKMYLVSRSIEGLSNGTIEGYKILLSKFFNDIRLHPSEIDTNIIRIWLYKIKSERNVSDRYLEWCRIVIHTFYEWCVNNSILERNPVRGISKIKYVMNRRSFLTQEELEAVRESTTCIRDRCIVELYYSTAMRCTELTTVRIQDVDLQNKTVQVFNKKGKRYKTCYLNDKSVYWLKKYIPTRDTTNDYLIQGLRGNHNKLSKNGIEAVIRRIMEGCEVTKKVTPSTFRHTAATQGLNNGMSLTDVQAMLDHKSPETTLIYADRYSEDVKSSHRKAII